MIYESHFWKIKIANRLKAFKAFLKSRKRYTETIGVEVEEFIFTTSFMVRKIGESNKLSDELERNPLRVSRYNSIKRMTHYLDRYDIPEYYDLNNGTEVEVTMKNLLNMFIHSYCFHFYFDSPSDWKSFNFSIFINSDYSKDEFVYEIKIEDYFQFLEDVIQDHVVSVTQRRNVKTGVMEIINKSRM